MEKEEEAREQREEDEQETPAQRIRRQAEQALLLAKSPRYCLFAPSCSVCIIILTTSSELKREADNAAIAENMHVMTEFGLWVLSAALKNNLLDFASEEVQAAIRPFEAILLNALDSRYVKQIRACISTNARTLCC